MSDAIIVAIITGACAIAAQFIISSRSSKDLYAKLDKQSELADKQIEAKLDIWRTSTDLRIDELTREVREHNNFARRMPVMEEQITVLNREMKEVKSKL